MNRPTLNDVAKLAGVSKNTASLALRHDSRIPLKTREKIEGIAREVGYQRNPTVSHLMAELSKSRMPSIKSSLAILNANPDPKAFTKHPTIPTYVDGCRNRAAELGYNIDSFWLHDEKLDGKSLNRILRARNIRGGVIVGLTRTRFLPEKFLSTWEQFHFVVTGVRTLQPTLSFACTDHHNLAIKAFQQAASLGYRRPAMVLDLDIDDVVDGRFSAGIRTAQSTLAGLELIKPFYFRGKPSENKIKFSRWFAKNRPDVVLTLFNVVRRWIEDLNVRVPQDVGIIQLEWRKDDPECAGMNQHNEVVGRVAVDMAINMIHYHPPGIPEFPLATLVGSSWVDGRTVRARKAGELEPAAL